MYNSFNTIFRCGNATEMAAVGRRNFVVYSNSFCGERKGPWRKTAEAAVRSGGNGRTVQGHQQKVPVVNSRPVTRRSRPNDEYAKKRKRSVIIK